MPKYLRYYDLQKRGIVNNRVTLSNWIRENDFPAGFLLGPNSRAWREDEVEDWLASRPTASKQSVEREAA
jgi:predicted DNA-binding transcriptional regulator AlpA